MRAKPLLRWINHLPRLLLRRVERSTIRLGAFIAFVCLAFVVSEGWRTYQDQHTEVTQAQTAMENLSRSLVQHAEDTVELADSTVFDVVARIEEERLGPQRIAALGSVLSLRISATPRLSGLFIFDANGDWLASSLATAPNPPPSIAERDYFRRHRDLSDRSAQIGPALRGQATGAWLMTVSRRFDHPDGTFAGIVVATIDIEYLARRYAQFDIGRHGVIALFTARGTLLARHPFDPATIGGDLSRDPLFREEPPRPYGRYSYVSRFDGVERLSGFARGQRFPLLLTAAVSRTEALTAWRLAALSRLAIAATIVVVILVLGAMLMAHVRSHQEMERRLAALARTDSVTELPNRRALDHELDREWRRAVRLGSELTVLMLDLDRFKTFNDTYGHLAGDACLRDVAGAITRSVGRAGDFVARYGGEEIAVLLPDTSGPHAVLVAERIRTAIEALQIKHAGNPPSEIVTASIGVAAAFPSAHIAPTLLIEAADKALYEAKASGRNRIATAQDVLLRHETGQIRRTA